MPDAAPVTSLTPILYVDAIEPCLPFWVDRLGFAVTATVPHGDAVGFAILAMGTIEVMYQTHASLAADMPAIGSMRSPTVLYLHVTDLDAVLARLDGVDVVVPRRRTFYGADEVYVRTPGGHVVGFAATAGPPAQP